MATPPFDVDAATGLIHRADEVVEAALKELVVRGGIDANESFAYDLAHAASALATARASLTYATKGDVEARLVGGFPRPGAQ